LLDHVLQLEEDKLQEIGLFSHPYGAKGKALKWIAQDVMREDSLLANFQKKPDSEILSQVRKRPHIFQGGLYLNRK
jgi:hypothetical protein